MKSIYEKAKKLKNIVKFTRLANNRKSEELRFIRRHLVKIENSRQINPHRFSINLEKQVKIKEDSVKMKKRRDLYCQDSTDFAQLLTKFENTKDTYMPNGKDFTQFLSPKK